MLIRTQIQLLDSQVAALREISARTGQSLAELVRQGVDLYLASQKQPEPKQPAPSVGGRSHSA